MAAIADLQTQMAAIATAALGIPMALVEAAFDNTEQTGFRRTEAELQQDYPAEEQTGFRRTEAELQWEYNPLITIDDSSDEEPAPAEVQDEHLSIEQLEAQVYQQEGCTEENLGLPTAVGGVCMPLQLGHAAPAEEQMDSHAPQRQDAQMSAQIQRASNHEINTEEHLGAECKAAAEDPVSMEVMNAPAEDGTERDEEITAGDLHFQALSSIEVENPSCELAEALTMENTVPPSPQPSSAERVVAKVGLLGHLATTVTTLGAGLPSEKLQEAITDDARGQETGEVFSVGQLVQMRDGDREWRQGYVTSVSPLRVCYKMDGPNARGYTFDEVQATREETNNRSIVTGAEALSLELSKLRDEPSSSDSVHETVLPVRDDNNHDAVQGPETRTQSWLSRVLCNRRSQSAPKRNAHDHGHEPARKLRKF